MKLTRPIACALLTLSLGACAIAPPPQPIRVSQADGGLLQATPDSVQHAIDQLGENGGVVELTKGTYLTGPVRLKNNVTLQIDEGATLKFATDPALYPVMKTRYEGVEIMNYAPLISAYGCHDVKVTGKGTLDGQGPKWWAWAKSFSPKKKEAPTAPGSHSGQGVGGSPESRQLMLNFTADRAGKYPVEQRVFGPQHPGFRPCLFEPYECKNVTLEGVTIRQSPFWNIHPLYCEDVVVRNVTVFGDGPNTDGCDPDSCKNVLIEGCHFTTGDDCIAIKSGRDGDGLRVNRPTENITIRNCTMTSGHGGVTLGSESSGSIRHVLAEDCVMNGPDWGIRLKSTRGRGGEDADIVCRRITINSAKKGAITIDMKYADPKDNSTAAKTDITPIMRDIRIEDVTAKNVPQAMRIVGLQESPIENLTLKNVSIQAKTGALVESVIGFERTNVTVTAKTGQAWTIKDVHEVK